MALSPEEIDRLVAHGAMSPDVALMLKQGTKVNPYGPQNVTNATATQAIPPQNMTPSSTVPIGPPVSPYVPLPDVNTAVEKEFPQTPPVSGFSSGIPQKKVGLNFSDTEADKKRIELAAQKSAQAAADPKFGNKEYQTSTGTTGNFDDSEEKTPELNTDTKPTTKQSGGGSGAAGSQYGIDPRLKANEDYYNTLKSLIDSSSNITEKQALNQALQARVVADQFQDNNKLVQAKEEEMQLARKQRLDAAKVALIDLNGQAEQLANYKEDPERVWNNKTDGEKAFAGLGILLAGLGQGLMKSDKNAAIDQYNTMVNRDVAAQRANYNAKTNSYNAKSSAYGKMMDLYKDQDSADAASRVLLLDQGERKLKELMLSSASQQVQAQGQQALNQLAMERAKTEREFAFTQYNLAHGGTGGTSEKGVHQFFDDEVKLGIPELEDQSAKLQTLLSGLKPGQEIPTLDTRNFLSRGARAALDWIGGAGTGTKTFDTPEEQTMVQSLERIKSGYLHALSGAAISPTEMTRLQQSLQLANTSVGINEWVNDLNSTIARFKATAAAANKPQGVKTKLERQKAYTPPPAQPKPQLGTRKPEGN